MCVNDLSDYDAIINAAAESHVDNSFINSKEFTKTNTLGLHNLLEQSMRANVSKFVHINTDEVYGEN